jgi:hypothetical protein
MAERCEKYLAQMDHSFYFIESVYFWNHEIALTVTTIISPLPLCTGHQTSDAWTRGISLVSDIILLLSASDGGILQIGDTHIDSEKSPFHQSGYGKLESRHPAFATLRPWMTSLKTAFRVL